MKNPIRNILSVTTLILIAGSATAGISDVMLSPTGMSRSSPCEQTAARMKSACVIDASEEYQITAANCINLSDPDAADECYEEAQEVRFEARFECLDQRAARNDACDLLGEDRYDPDPLLDPKIEFIDPLDVPDVYPPNPYLSLAEGRTLILRDGQGEELVVVHVTDEVREIQGVDCRVVVDLAFAIEEDEEDGDIEYVAEEVTDDWYAQDTNGNVYYCGELSRNYEDGLLENLDGSFEAGKEHAKGGVLVRAVPVVGEAHRQEFALEEAEDIAQYLSTEAVPGDEEGGENEAFPCAPAGCVKTFEFSPLEPESSEFKYYLPGVGFVLAVSMEDGELTGDREELACVGDSIDVIYADDCDIDSPDELFEELCELAAEFFCD